MTSPVRKCPLRQTTSPFKSYKESIETTTVGLDSELISVEPGSPTKLPLIPSDYNRKHELERKSKRPLLLVKEDRGHMNDY